MPEHEPLLPLLGDQCTITPVVRDEVLRFNHIRHSHDMDQLIYAISGVVSVTTDVGTWVVPPNRAVWVPRHVEHATRSHGPLKIRALFVCNGGHINLPRTCCVIGVSPLLKELILRAADYETQNRSGIYIQHLTWLLMEELSAVPVSSLYLPLPETPILAELCTRLQAEPTWELDLETTASHLGMSRRTFMRLFRKETGMTFGQWRQHARLLASLPMLALGESILNVALDCGYQSPSAFTAVFRRVLGMTPRDYFRSEK